MLYLCNRPAAFLYGFLYGGKFYAFQTGFDSKYGRYSPGDVLCQMVFQVLIDQETSEFDYLRGDEAYKSVFADSERATTTFYVFRSRSAAFVDRWSRLHVVRPVRRRLKRLLQQVGVIAKANGKPPA